MYCRNCLLLCLCELEGSIQEAEKNNSCLDPDLDEARFNPSQRVVAVETNWRQMRNMPRGILERKMIRGEIPIIEKLSKQTKCKFTGETDNQRFYSNRAVIGYLAEIKCKFPIPPYTNFIDQKRFDNDTDLMAEDLQKFTTPTTEVGPSVDTRAVNFRHSSNITQKKLRRAMPLVGDRAAVLKGFVTAIDNADIVRRNDESVIADSAHSTAKATVVSKKKSPSSVDTNMTDGDRSLADFCDEPDKECSLLEAYLVNIFVSQPLVFASSSSSAPKIKKPLADIPAKPFLIARVRESVSVSSITERKIDSLLGLDDDKGGPVVQQLKRHSDNSVKLIFRDESNRDKARELLDRPEADKLFQNVHAPEKSYPVILRLNGVRGLSTIRDDGSVASDELRNARTKQRCTLINKINTEYPVLKGIVSSARILFSRDDFTLVRVSLSCKATRDRYLEQGRIIVDNSSHAFIEVDVNKEVKLCNRCQGYGHLARFCNKPISCGKCSLAHYTQSCNVSHPNLKCASCSQNHAAGFYTRLRFKCLQTNLRHSKLASASLAEVILENSLDVILIQEPYALCSPIPTLAHIPPGYIAFHSLSTDHAYGAAILVKLSLANSCRAVSCCAGNHIAVVDLKIAKGTVRFISAYLRPSISNYLATLQSELSSLITPLTVLSVDDNARNRLWNSLTTDHKGVDFESFMSETNLQLANLNASELDFVPGGTTFVDVTAIGGKIIVSRWFFASIPSLSDHPFIYFEVDRPCSSHQSERTHAPRPPHISRINISVLLLKVASSIAELADVLSTAACESRCNLPSPQSRGMPWWNKDLCALRHKTRLAFKCWSANRSDENRKLFSSLKAVYQGELRRAKRQSWNLLCKANPNSNDLFSAIKELSGKTRGISLPDAIVVDGSTVTDAKLILNQCAVHFFPSEPPSLSTHRAVESLVEDVVLVPTLQEGPIVTVDELAAAVDSLNYKAAPGNDGISAAIIKECFPVIKMHLLSLLANVSVSTSFLSHGNPLNLINNLAKVIEKIVLSRLQWHSSTDRWLSPNQHGFMAGRSTESAGHALVSFCEAGISNKCITACAFLDIKSAFDAAWHPAVLAALIRRGCPAYLVKLVASFLSNRLALLAHKGSTASFTINLGCPQGGVLSPFLWSVLIDDVLRLIFDFVFCVVGYADDLTLATSHKDPAQATRNLQLMCNHVLSWCIQNKMSLSAVKSVFMLIFNKIVDGSDLYLSINGTCIHPSPDTQFLGFTVDSRLKWSYLRATWGYDDLRLRYLYQAAVEPIVLYGCSLWAPFLSTKKGVKSVRSFQRVFSIARTRAFKTTSTDALLVLSNLTPLDLTVLRTAYNRFMTGNFDSFSPSSKRWLSRIFPDIMSLPTAVCSESYLLPRWPPWVCLPRLLYLDEGCLLGPSSEQVMRIFVTTVRATEGPHFALLSTDHKRVLGFKIVRARRDCLIYSRFAKCLEAMVSIRDNITLCVCKTPAISYGLRLSRASCETTDLSHPAHEIHLPKEVAVAAASILIQFLQEQEWSIGKNAPVTRSFFPTVKGAHMLFHSQLNCQISQILSGHSALNSHQFRFKFRPSPACACGDLYESIEHFLFHCSLFSRERRSFISACKDAVVTWPPQFYEIPMHRPIWNAMAVLCAMSTGAVGRPRHVSTDETHGRPRHMTEEIPSDRCREA
uniref:Reverse transcriptase domain-containing protein n=1 Tax=Daphnia galeata TaxID=27404 RepID=A0A8J2S0P8_9CRUS|nr:unnamed protein product [Daphnia galeata]